MSSVPALVASHLFTVPVLVLWAGLEKSKYVWLIFAWYMEVRNIFAGSNSEHRGRCSTMI